MAPGLEQTPAAGAVPAAASQAPPPSTGGTPAAGQNPPGIEQLLAAMGGAA
jgi:hypothetical protein